MPRILSTLHTGHEPRPREQLLVADTILKPWSDGAGAQPPAKQRTFGVDVWTCQCGGKRKVLAIITSRRTAEEIVFLGKAVMDAGAGGHLSTGVAPVSDLSWQRLEDAFSSGGTTTSGFGARVVGKSGLLSSSGFGLAVSRPVSSLVYLYPQGASAPFDPTARRTLAGSNQLGSSLAVGDLTGDGNPDLLIGEGIGHSAWLFVNQAVQGKEFDGQAGAGFFQGRVQSAYSMGAGCAMGDFNGDGALDAAVADDSDGTGKVNLWF